MPSVLTSLAQLATGHSVFERDQVLTHDQLNSVADYGDDQGRLTRVRLLGVGVACGLRVALAEDVVTVTRGVGVTSDGDLLHVEQDTRFDRFKPYDESYPAYPPLYVNRDVTTQMVSAFELVARGAVDERARPLAEFARAAGGPLADRVAVLLMESYVKDDDLCTGTDCDNLGREAVHTPKVILVEREIAAGLRERLTTPADAFAELPPVVADRPALPAALDSAAALAAVYQPACASTQRRLADALPRLHKVCAGLFGADVTRRSGEEWARAVGEHARAAADAGSGVQYYYDFLKDVVDLYEAIRERHLDDAAVCAPPLDAFPKHLLLGELAPSADAALFRTGHYPSPAVGRAAGESERTRFLLRTLETLVERFRLTTGEGPVRVTPSAFEDRPLDERAIPFYYAAGRGREDARDADAVHRAWSYRLTRRGLEAHNYSYHAESYGAQGAAANPLAAQIGRFAFFRVEGHVGRRVDDVTRTLEGEVAARNLPFAVRAVMLAPAAGRPPVVVKPRPRVTDLHRFHQLLRKDLVHRLDEVNTFSAKVEGQVLRAVDTKVLAEAADQNEGVAVREVATRQSAAVVSNATAARAKLNQPYAAYRAADQSWRADVKQTLTAAGQFKAELSPVVKTEFATPFDTMISTSHVNWLPWLDEIIRTRDEQADERLVFSRFAAQHPEMEHFAGVTRGGTFVLAYDAGGTVVGDFMLPYLCCDDDDDLVEPELPDPEIRPPLVKEGGLRVTPSRVASFGTLFDSKWSQVRPLLDEKIDIRLNPKVVGPQVGGGGVVNPNGYTDRVLGMYVDEQRYKREKIDTLRAESEKPGTAPEMRQLYERQIRETEVDLSKTVRDTATYVSQANVDLAAGSEGFIAVSEIGNSVAKISDAGAVTEVRTGLEGVQANTRNPALGAMLGGIMFRR